MRSPLQSPGATGEGYDSLAPNGVEDTGGVERPPVPPKITPHAAVGMLLTVAPGAFGVGRVSVSADLGFAVASS